MALAPSTNLVPIGIIAIVCSAGIFACFPIYFLLNIRKGKFNQLEEEYLIHTDKIEKIYIDSVIAFLGSLLTLLSVAALFFRSVVLDSPNSLLSFFQSELLFRILVAAWLVWHIMLGGHNHFYKKVILKKPPK